MGPTRVPPDVPESEGSPIDHSQCVSATWSHRTHLHEGVPGAWLFPSEVPKPRKVPT